MPAKQRSAMWVPAYADLPDHPKTTMLRRRLGLSKDAACMRLFRLWWWAMAYAPDGDVTDFDPIVLADAADFEGDAAAFVDALVGTGWLVARDGRTVIHEWEAYGGKVERRRRQNADAQARFRDRHDDRPLTDAPRNDDVSITSDAGERAPSLSRSTSSSEPEQTNDDKLSPRGRAGEAPPPKPPVLLDERRPIERRTAPWDAPPEPPTEPPDAGDELKATADLHRAQFDAYADAAKIPRSSPEYRRRWAKAAFVLAEPGAEGLTPDRIRAMTAYTMARRSKTGHMPTPDLADVLCEAAAFDRWQAAGGHRDADGAPVIPTAPRTPRASPSRPPSETQADGGLAAWRAQQAARRGPTPPAGGS